MSPGGCGATEKAHCLIRFADASTESMLMARTSVVSNGRARGSITVAFLGHELPDGGMVDACRRDPDKRTSYTDPTSMRSRYPPPLHIMSLELTSLMGYFKCV